MSAPELDIAGMVAQAQAGNQAAFDAIYDRFADPLFRFLYAACGDRELAEELTGDLWVRVVEHLPAFRLRGGDQEAAFTGWLYRIARNLVIDAYRCRKQEWLPLDEMIAADQTPLDARVIAAEDHTSLCGALRYLTTEQREVLVLRFFEERNIADVARVTGRSQAAVKVMQHRALGSLARLLGVKRGGSSRP